MDRYWPCEGIAGLLAGTDVTQQWHHKLMEEPMIRVYGDVNQSGITVDVFDR